MPFNATPSFDDEPSLLMRSTAATSPVSLPGTSNTQKKNHYAAVSQRGDRHDSRYDRTDNCRYPRHEPAIQRVTMPRTVAAAHLTSYCHATLPCSNLIKTFGNHRQDVDVIQWRDEDKLSLQTSLQAAPAARPITNATDAARSQLLFHPHSNDERLLPGEEYHPRAGLRLLQNLLHAIRALSFTNDALSTRFTALPSMNHYVDRVQVHQDRNLVVLSVHIDRLFALLFDPAVREGAQAMKGAPFGQTTGADRLRAAHQQLSRRFGERLEISLRPNVAFQRSDAEFISHCRGDLAASQLHTEQSGLFQFGPVYRGVLAAANAAGVAWSEEEDIVCGFVVPEEVRLHNGNDAHPFEPSFFQKLSCKLQIFNGDVSQRLTTNTFARLNQQLSGGPNGGLHEDLVLAFSAAMSQRHEQFRAALACHAQHHISEPRCPLPQVFRPFIVRLPHNSQAAQVTGVGSVATGLNHGLQPISLPAVSEALDQAIILAVLKYCHAPLRN